MTERKYRTAIYDTYVSVQVPEWGEDNKQASRVSSAGTLKRLRGWLPPDPNAKCLDLGCGPGLLLLALRNAGYCDVRGVDVSPQSYTLARAAGAQLRKRTFGNFFPNRQSPSTLSLLSMSSSTLPRTNSLICSIWFAAASRRMEDLSFKHQTPRPRGRQAIDT